MQNSVCCLQRTLSGQTSLIPSLLSAHIKDIRSVVSIKPSGDNWREAVTFVLSNNWSGYVKFAELEVVAGKHPEYK